jgi:hypothetical protein
MVKSALRAVAVPADQAEPLVAVEEMIATLKDLPRSTGDRACWEPIKRRSTGSTRWPTG